MSNKFSGLCVGGPYAGKQIVAASESFTLQEMPPLKEVLQASISDKPEPLPAITTHRYTWTHIGPFALWLHQDTNLNQALNAMALAYQEKHT